MTERVKLPPTSQLIREWADATTIEAGVANGTAAAAIHAACYLCWQALERRWITPAEALGDFGIVHQLVHAASLDPACTPAWLYLQANRVALLEAKFAQ